ncbi:2-oxoglutarate dehydrogenase E1 component [Streptomyces antimycoticus]
MSWPTPTRWSTASASDPDLDIIEHGLTLWDLEREFAVGGFAGKTMMKLRDILGVLRDSYCRTTGIEFMHIQDPKQRKWIQDRVERSHDKPEREEQLRILRRLNAAEAFETFLQTKYVGQKRFSLEGGESVIPLLDAVLDAAAESRLDEVVVGMAHRGRLNVLANIVGKSYAQIFREFEGNLDPKSMHGSGDVKYHLGAEGTFTGLDGEQIKVSLTANPSHLEAVDPVLEGVVRASCGRSATRAGCRNAPEPAHRETSPRRLGRDSRKQVNDAEPPPSRRPHPHRRRALRRRPRAGVLAAQPDDAVTATRSPRARWPAARRVRRAPARGWRSGRPARSGGARPTFSIASEGRLLGRSPSRQAPKCSMSSSVSPASSRSADVGHPLDRPLVVDPVSAVTARAELSSPRSS